MLLFHWNKYSLEQGYNDIKPDLNVSTVRVTLFSPLFLSHFAHSKGLFYCLPPHIDYLRNLKHSVPALVGTLVFLKLGLYFNSWAIYAFILISWFSLRKKLSEQERLVPFILNHWDLLLIQLPVVLSSRKTKMNKSQWVLLRNLKSGEELYIYVYE